MCWTLNFSRPQCFITVCSVLTVLAFVGCGPAAEPVATLSGKVMSGDTVIGVCKVAISNPVTLKTKAATVDEKGNFKIEEIPYGEYNVKVYPKQNSGPEEVFDPRIPKKLQRFQTSGVTVSVQSTDVDLDIDLKK